MQINLGYLSDTLVYTFSSLMMLISTHDCLTKIMPKQSSTFPYLMFGACNGVHYVAQSWYFVSFVNERICKLKKSYDMLTQTELLLLKAEILIFRHTESPNISL